MLSQCAQIFFIDDLLELDPAENNWFREDSIQAMAGRSLLDALEYLHRAPSYPGRFRQLANAHSVRLICHCLRDKDLDRRDLLERTERFVLDTAKRLLKARKDTPPHYGDDFWDWAAIVEALVQVRDTFPKAITDKVIERELNSFHDGIKVGLPAGLTTGTDGEWYGPGTAATAHRVLRKFQDRFAENPHKLLPKLRKQALELVVDGKYKGSAVEPYQVLWHYGQVVDEFPKDALSQAKAIGKLASLDAVEKAPRAYALARVLQGSRKIGNQSLVKRCVSGLYKCQDFGPPLGQGLIGDNVKGSLNALEVLWPMLTPGHKGQLRSMIDALLRARVAANTIGIVVAIENETKALIPKFEAAGASVTQADDETKIVEKPEYRAAVRTGKSGAAALEAARTLIEKHKARWVIMCGIAGSLGSPVPNAAGGVQFVGPNKGSIVVAASSAPFEIRDKVRKEVKNAPVPFDGNAWMMIPSDPLLFRLAHKAAERLFGDSKTFYEGLIVT